MTISIALYQPDIAQNVGSIIRTAVAWGVPVHIIEPCGFPWNAPKMRRAGMDYLDRAQLTRHPSWAQFLEKTTSRLVLLTTRGSKPLQDIAFQDGDILLFGRESAGVPEDVHQQADIRVRIPMVAGERSINLAQSVAVTAFTALKTTKSLP